MPIKVASPFSRDDMPKALSDRLLKISSRNEVQASHHICTLCRQCCAMFHGPGIVDLFSPTGFQHSQLSTFGSRAECRICQFLWNEDLVGSTNQVHYTRRLGDLVRSSGTRQAMVKQPEKAYVILRAIKLSTDVWEYLELKVISDRGRMLWQPSHNLHVVVPKGMLPNLEGFSYAHMIRKPVF